jgi:IS5 family transposase
MITYARLVENSAAFPALTGMTRDEFDTLFVAYTAAADAHRAARTHTKRGAAPLRRAAGAGHPHDHDPRTRLLIALVWVRVYPTYELLGLLFGLNKSNAWHNTRDALEVLEGMTDFPFDPPGKGRPRVATRDHVMDTFPEVRAVIDAKEQGYRRPAGWGNQEPFYSGKKRRHTVKNQVVCTPSGRIGAVSPTVPGRTSDLTLLRLDRTLDRLPAGAGVMTDKGYVGVRADAGGRPVVIPTRATKNHPLTDDQKFGNRCINRERVVVEHVMAQLNRFQVLRQTFRGVFGGHTQVFRVVALLVDRRIAATPLKTYPAAA